MEKNLKYLETNEECIEALELDNVIFELIMRLDNLYGIDIDYDSTERSELCIMIREQMAITLLEREIKHKAEIARSDSMKKLNTKELKMILDMLDDSDDTIIFKDDRYTFKAPQNTYDTNCHLIDNLKKLTYLIDLEDYDENFDIEELKSVSWKTKQN